ncbi:M24 family metallopeptidase [Thalassotalea piscium]|uniref:Xaa-Pro aminopeptidase/Xaa-Pro dipeptidase n=1 Tax=Thalassotalea piscium TaxID=1230533 RepID=A0A7X0TSL1_9GAMM|nr:Xaa-Pro peptidase family protein [Thalassotalea piscium]MBB6542236.1 Xaa-Pro aminopeptidase/Xaa-Pro dipeptidase [Thalassotalea piscium]
MKIKKLRQQLLTAPQCGVLIFSEINIRYISGFSGHAATLLITEDTNYLITDYRYFEQAKQEAVGFSVICRDRANQTLTALIIELLNQNKCQTLLFESAHINVEQWQGMNAQIMQQTKVLAINAVVGVIEKLRMIKSADELSFIKQAAKIADQALANILPLVKEGITERELAIELDYQMSVLGSEEVSFATILLFGERSALPHGIPSNRQLKRGDIILIDFGAVINGYRSDMTRTFIFGKADNKQKQIYQLVQTAQQAALDKIIPGVSGKALYEESDNVLARSEYKDYAGEGLGHGVGLQLHEQPFLGPDCTIKIEQGCVITIEPGIYIPNWGGVRIEDDVVLTEQGLEIITQAPKQLQEL